MAAFRSRCTLLLVSYIASAGAQSPVFPLSPGCGMLGCDPMNTHSIAIDSPQASSALLSPPVLKWSVPTANRHCSNTTALTPSPGCVSGGSLAVCTVTNQCAGEGTAKRGIGLLGVDYEGKVHFNYSGPGAARCTHTEGSYGYPDDLPINLPVMSTQGDTFAWDTDAIAHIYPTGKVDWVFKVYPTVECPGFISQASFTNLSTLAFFVSPQAAVFTITPNSVPIASVALKGNDSGTQVFPDPPPGRRNLRGEEQASDLEVTQTGMFIPVAPTGVHGARMLIVGQFRGKAGEMSPHLYLLALDQRHQAIGRIWWYWQYLLPTDGTPLSSCLAGSTRNSSLPRVSAPLVLENSSALIIVTCGNVSMGFAVAIDTPHPTVPAALWTSVIGQETLGSSSNSKVIYTVGDPRTGSDGPAIVWIMDRSTGGITAIDSSDGHQLQSTGLQPLFGEMCNITGSMVQIAAQPLGMRLNPSSAANDPNALLVFPLNVADRLFLASASLLPSTMQLEPVWCIELPETSDPNARAYVGQLGVVSASNGSSPIILYDSPESILGIGPN